MRYLARVVHTQIRDVERLEKEIIEKLKGTKAEKLFQDILDKHYKEKLVIGIANKQDLSNRLTPEFCEKILSKGGRYIKFHSMIAIEPIYKEKIHAILRDAIKSISM